VEKYIKTIFPDDWKVAIAIASKESGTVDPATKQFYYDTNAENRSGVETSIGLFQINLKSADTLVHFHRIPGESLNEKITWLKNPYNNALYAFWIYTHSGWYPWSSYSSGDYLKFMK